VENGGFTNDQRQFYEENGFIVFPKLVPDKVLDDCLVRFLDICNGKVEGTVFTVMKDRVLREKGAKGENLINKIQDFMYDDVFFEKYACDENIVNVVKSIIGPNITGAHSMLINKPPDSSYDFSRHPLHQDMHYFPFRPVNSIVASWTAMERINEQNGCLFVIPGSHKSKLYPHGYPSEVKNKAYHGVQGFDHIPRVNLEMEKGDTVFFHPLLLHGSGPNTSKGFRKAISVHYADSNSYFVNVKGTSQENIEKEIIALTTKMGTSLSFVDIWKYKSRLVCGKPGNFQQMSKL